MDGERCKFVALKRSVRYTYLKAFHCGLAVELDMRDKHANRGSRGLFTWQASDVRM